MAEYRFQVELHSTTNLPKDDVVNVLYFENNAPDTHEGACDGIAGAYQNLNDLLSSTMTGGLTIKVYELTGGQPVFTKTYAAGHVTPGTTSAPREVALCLSYATVDDPDSSTPRRRGRIYVGPFSVIAAERPSSAFVDAVIGLGVELATVGTASNTTWLMYSRTDSTTEKIESIWCDNAWDTQRRRGWSPTSRTVEDVQ